MTARTTKQLLMGGALALTLAAPAAYAQTPDAPATPPVAAAPAATPATPVISGFTPTGAEVGRTVTITGSGFSGATAVSLSGVPATHIVNSDTQITMTVPSGATTGPISVSTPLGTTASPESLNVTSPARKRTRFRVGPEVGVYLPTSNKTRNQFGSTWYTLGLGLGNINTITTKGQTTFDLQILYQKKGDNHAFLAPVGIGYRQAFSANGPNVAYYGVTGDLYLADLRSGDYGVHSGLRTGVGGSALLGVNFGDSGYLEARYLFVSKIKSFDLSGLDLTAGYRF